MPRLSLRTLARQLDVSAATVSLALRDSPRVKPATKKRIVQAAHSAGYHANPLVRSVMAALRRSSHECYRGTLMALNYADNDQPALIPYHRELLRGAEQRAAELGYALSHCWVGPQVLPLQRLNSIVEARDVQGIVVMPFADARDFSGIEWRNLAAVALDYCVSAPTLHVVLPDHHLSLLGALERMASRGYTRPGLVLESKKDARVRHRWSAGYHSFWTGHCAPDAVPILLCDAIDRAAFLRWFERHRPDVIAAHRQAEITLWLKEAGVSIPRDVGYFQLNWTERTAPCAGLDLQPTLLGGAAVESVIAQLQRDERGIPRDPKTIMLTARWMDGPTLRSSG